MIPATAAMSEMGIELIVEAFAVVVIGGLGSMRGAFVGALVVGVLRSVAICVYPELEMLLIYLIVIAVLLLRPRGLFGGPPREGTPSSWALAVARAARRCRSCCAAYHVSLMLPFMAYGVVLLGLNLLFGYTGLVSFGHALFIGIGAYTGAVLTTHARRPLARADPARRRASLGAVVAAPVGALCVRYVKIYFGMLTLAFGMVFYTFLLKFYRLTGRRRGHARAAPAPARAATWTRCPRPPTWSGPYYYYSLGVLVVAAARHVAHRALALRPLPASTIRDNPAKAESARGERDALSLVRLRDLGGVRGRGRRAPRPADRQRGPHARLLDALRQPRLHGAARAASRSFFGPVLGAFVFIFLQDTVMSVVPYWRLVFGAILAVIVIFAPGRAHGPLRARRRPVEVSRA